jgi:hypothetical protein
MEWSKVKYYIHVGGCTLLCFAILPLSFYLCSRDGDNKQKHEAVTQKDSFLHSTSTCPEDEINRLVITSTGDSMFHYSTMCNKLLSSPKLSNEYLERLKGKWMCPVCGMKEAQFYIHEEEYMSLLKELDSI